jgi:hypothetical protein
MLAGGALALVLSRARTTETLPVIATAAPEPVKTEPVPAPLVPAPVVEPLRPPPPSEPTPRRPERRRHVASVAPREPTPRRSPEAVQNKYQTVKREYAAFKKQYGAVLEERWTAIASEITFGKSDKFTKVDAMLDALRKEMAKVRSGG